MGAAGLTSSSAEMSARGKCGMRLNLDLVPTREPNMTAYEIMLSESQERMLVVGKKGKEQAINEIFEKWDLNCVEVGEVIEEDMLELYQHGELQAAIPPSTLAAGSGAPVYTRETRPPSYLQETQKFDEQSITESEDLNAILQALLASPNIASKRYVFQQYDHMVQTNTMQAPGGDAAVLQIKGTDKALAMCTDCNGRYMYLDAYEGAKGAVIEAARNIACTGAKPLAITNCLNFGNPYDPEVYWSFEQAIRGMSDACLALETPVTGGNVSFYNESPESAVYPTPVIGMVGLLEDRKKMLTSAFQQEGGLIYLLGRLPENIGGSEYLYLKEKIVAGQAPQADLEKAKILIQTLTQLAEKQMIQSAHDCAEGGLAVALAEACFPNGLGAKIEFAVSGREDFNLFGEAHNNVVVSCAVEQEAAMLDLCKKNGQPYLKLGQVGSGNLQINQAINVSVDKLLAIYESSLERVLHS